MSYDKLVSLLLILVLVYSTSVTGDTTIGEPYPDQPYDAELISEGINYLTNLSIIDNINSEGLQWSGYQYSDNTIMIYGSETNYYNLTDLPIRISGVLSYAETTDDIYEFNLIAISSNVYYGDPEHNFAEIIELSKGIEEVTEFIDIYPNYTLSADLMYIADANLFQTLADMDMQVGYYYRIYLSTYGNLDYGTVEPISVREDDTEENATEVITDTRHYGCGPSSSWLDVIVSDNPFDVIEISGTTTANLTEEQVKEIVKSDPYFSSWLDGLQSYTICGYYDGYSSWYVNIWSYETMDYGYATVNDTTSEIIDYFKFIPIPATRTSAEILELVLADEDIKSWVKAVDRYEHYTYYDGGGTWFVSLYDPVIFSNYAYVRVDDQTGEIIDKYTYLIEPPENTVDDIYEILRDIEELPEFLENFSDAEVSVYYNGYDQTWYIYVYSPVVIEAYIFISINDKDGEIIELHKHIPDSLPTLSISDVENIVHSSELYNNFSKSYEVQYEYKFFYNEHWYVYIDGIHDDGTYRSMYFIIDDEKRQIIEYNDISTWYNTVDVPESAEVASGDYSSIGRESNLPKDGISLEEVLAEEKTDTDLLPYSGLLVFISFITLISISKIIRRQLP